MLPRGEAASVRTQTRVPVGTAALVMVAELRVGGVCGYGSGGTLRVRPSSSHAGSADRSSSSRSKTSGVIAMVEVHRRSGAPSAEDRSQSMPSMTTTMSPTRTNLSGASCGSSAERADARDEPGCGRAHGLRHAKGNQMREAPLSVGALSSLTFADQKWSPEEVSSSFCAWASSGTPLTTYACCPSRSRAAARHRSVRRCKVVQTVSPTLSSSVAASVARLQRCDLDDESWRRQVQGPRHRGAVEPRRLPSGPPQHGEGVRDPEHLPRKE